MPLRSVRIHVDDGEKQVAAMMARSIDAGSALFTKDAGGQTMQVTGEVLAVIKEVLARAAVSDDLLLLDRTAEVSPEVAAKMLGVSRPLVYSRMDAGHLPFRQVGAHRRISVDEVLKHKADQDRASAVMAEMYVEFDDNAVPAP